MGKKNPNRPESFQFELLAEEDVLRAGFRDVGGLQVHIIRVFVQALIPRWVEIHAVFTGEPEIEFFSLFNKSGVKGNFHFCRFRSLVATST